MELKTIGLTKKFGSKTAVDNLNITLTNGVYGLLGANGAGKTTLMRLGWVNAIAIFWATCPSTSDITRIFQRLTFCSMFLP